MDHNMKSWAYLFVGCALCVVLLTGCASSQPEPSQMVARNAPDTLGKVHYLQHSYSMIRDFDYSENPPTDLYYTLLSDVYTWFYVQVDKPFQLEFEFEGDYQIKFLENNLGCDAALDPQTPTLVNATCNSVGEVVLNISVEDKRYNVIYPLVIQLISTPEKNLDSPVILTDLSIEEYELIQHPESDTRFFDPVIGPKQSILAKHETERGKPLGGVNKVYLENGDILHAEVRPEIADLREVSPEELPDDFQGLIISITLNGDEIFTTKAPVLANNSLVGLWTYENHWYVEVIRTAEETFRALTRGEIFLDGQSIGELNGYDEVFGFQLLDDKPCYFFEQNGRVGIVYDGQEIPLGYDRVLHNGCCSAGVLNPIIYENMVGFFAVRGEKWYYVEIGVFK